MEEQAKITQPQVTYQVLDDKLSFIGTDGQTHDLGIVLNKEGILDEKMNVWYNNIIQIITLDKIINYIKQIDNQILNSHVNSDDSYNISYGIFNEQFDNSWYSRKFSKSELKLFENKIEFIKYFFNMYNLDLDKILQLKFPGGIIEWKQNNILVTIF